MCTSNRLAPPQDTLGKSYWKLEFFLFSGDRVLQIPTVSILPQKDIPDNGYFSFLAQRQRMPSREDLNNI